jgi:hypothetical protein
MTMTKQTWARAMAGLCGIAGPVIPVATFAINPSPPPGLSQMALFAWAEPRAGFLLLDGWMHGMGSTLIVIFVLAVVQLSGAARGVMTRLIQLVAGTILVISLIEMTFYLTAAIAGGEFAPGLITDGLDTAVQHVTVPALLLSLAVVVLRTRVLARSFAWSGLAIGAGPQILALAGASVLTRPVVDATAIVQSAWFAGAALALSAMKPAAAATPVCSSDLASTATTPTEGYPLGDAIQPARTSRPWAVWRGLTWGRMALVGTD